MYLFPFVFFVAILFSIILKNRQHDDANSVQAFWERESKANMTPAKDISTLNYITISQDALPFLSNPTQSIAECQKTILSLSKCKILNLNGISNTDLKLRYGASNLTRLAQYDENFSSMQRTFAKWGRALKNEGYTLEAATVLEYALELGCDVRSIYADIIELYAVLEPDRLNALKERVKASNTPSKDRILSQLESYDSTSI